MRRVTDEAEVLRSCIDWLQRLEHEAHVVVNLRPASEDEAEFVPFDRRRFRVLPGLQRTSTRLLAVP